MWKKWTQVCVRVVGYKVVCVWGRGRSNAIDLSGCVVTELGFVWFGLVIDKHFTLIPVHLEMLFI